MVIRFATRKKVSLEFLEFHVENSTTCSYDWVEVRDGDNPRANLLGSKLCGSQRPGPINSTGKALYLSFHTDNTVVKNGFEIQAAAIDFGKRYYIRHKI